MIYQMSEYYLLRRVFFELRAIRRASRQKSHKSLRAHFIDFQIKTNVSWPMVEERIKVLPSASVSQPFYTEILISHFGRKICNA